MNTSNCEFCGSPAHVWFNCSKKPDGWRPERLKHGKPAAPAPEAAPARPEPKPKIKHPGGRPRLHADRRAYKTQKERERRARIKAEKAK